MAISTVCSVALARSLCPIILEKTRKVMAKHPATAHPALERRLGPGGRSFHTRQTAVLDKASLAIERKTQRSYLPVTAMA